MGTGGGCFEHCNEASVLKNVVNFLTSWGTDSFSKGLYFMASVSYILTLNDLKCI